MARLPSCTASEIDRALKRLGFAVAHQKGSHRYYISLATGKIVTSVPMHPGDMPRWLLKKIIRDADLTEDEFRKAL
ncbi:MAG: type II toxin-antitoxin system HicA family toxin [Patescibacteria group bacterium]